MSNPEQMNSAKTGGRVVPFPSKASTDDDLVEISRQIGALAVLALLLIGCFAKPLYELTRFAVRSELFSHILLIPVISLYLVWLRRGGVVWGSAPVRRVALLPLGIGLVMLVANLLATHSGLLTAGTDSLTWTTFSFFLFFLAASFLCLGRKTLRAVAFPLGFLIFIVPLPGFLVDWIAAFLQHASAVTAQALFSLSGMAVFRQGLVFQLPGIRLEVAPECSGIHSTLVLFITSLLAGYLFLTTPWRRVVIALAVVPLGILRNAVRICTIGQLCVHVSPDMIDSPLHHRGGPVFFAASLVPFFLLLYLLRRSEAKPAPVTCLLGKS